MYCHYLIRTINGDSEKPDEIRQGVCPDCVPELLAEFDLPVDELLACNASPALVVDGDLRVLAANEALKGLTGKSDEQMRGNLCGDVIACTHAGPVGSECGKTKECKTCPVRESVGHTVRTGEPRRDVPVTDGLGIFAPGDDVAFRVSTEECNGCVMVRIDRVEVAPSLARP